MLGYFLLFVCRGETMQWSCSHEVWSAERKKVTVFPPVSGIFIFSTSLWSQGTICVTDSCSIMTAQFLHTDTTLYRTVKSAGILVNFLLQVFVYDYLIVVINPKSHLTIIYLPVSEDTLRDFYLEKRVLNSSWSCFCKSREVEGVNTAKNDGVFL